MEVHVEQGGWWVVTTDRPERGELVLPAAASANGTPEELAPHCTDERPLSAVLRHGWAVRVRHPTAGFSPYAGVYQTVAEATAFGVQGAAVMRGGVLGALLASAPPERPMRPDPRAN
jgi:hypothetical protein